MSRSTKKGPYVDNNLIEKLHKARSTGNKNQINTWSRSAVITPEMVGYNIGVHNGREFVTVYVTESMVGHKLGEFSLTRKFTGHSKKGKVAKATGTTGSSEDK
jgi:small subunit ribosomal protein S19